ncbi:MAG: fumarylacetoacetate hydrolase family protein, partial [Candidatus Hodarchaeales archaeon]
MQFTVPGGFHIGLVKDQETLDLWEMASQEGNEAIFRKMEILLQQDGPAFKKTKNLLRKATPIAAPEPIQVLAPLMQPSKIICLGKNYVGHVKETKSAIPSNPILFPKFATSIIGPEEPIILPTFSNKVDYEIELGVVIGKKARKIQPEEALSYVAAYTIANDITARDLQR